MQILRLSQKYTIRFMVMTIVASAVLGCNPSNDFNFLEEDTDTNKAPTEPEVGNSALAFSPASLDFGPAAQSTDSVIKLVSVENTSSGDIFIDSFTGTNTNFTILASNCPSSTDPIESGGDCQLTLKFAPTTAGSLTTTLIANYGAAVGKSDLISIMGLSGTGVGSLNFAGISSVDQVSHNSARLNWSPEAQAVSFMIFRVIGGNLNYVDTKVNTSGTLTSYILTNLTPNTSYTFRAKAIDSLGGQDGNTTDVILATNANQAPALDSISAPVFYSGVTLSNINSRDVNTNTDVDIDGDPIAYSCVYDNVIDGIVNGGVGTCDSLMNETGGSPSFNAATGIFSSWEPKHADVGVDVEFAIEGSDPYGAKSITIFSGTIVAGTPSKPDVNSASPVGPANNNMPTLSGTAMPGMMINLFTNSACTSSVIGTGTADGSGNWTITASVADDSTNTIYAQAQNVIGNKSSCSATSVTYQEDSTAPSVVILSTTPSLFGLSTTPTVDGISQAGASIGIYSDSGCTTLKATGFANGSGSFSISVTLASEETLTFYGKATDAAGNISSCSATSATYTAFPIDPNNLILWGDSHDSAATFQGNTCTGAAANALGNPVGCLYDKSGNNNHFTAATNKPTVGPDGILFNGTNNILTNSTLVLNANSVLSYFLVVKLDTQTTNTGSCCRPFLSWVTSSPGLNPWVGQTRNSYTPNNNIFFGWDGSGLAAQATTPGEFAILSVFHDGATKLWNTYLNGQQNVSNHTIPASYNTTTPLYLGGDFANLARLFKGEILEVIIYNETISTTRKNNLEGYLACKYDLRDQLSVAHPFYNADGASSSGCP